MPSTKDIRRRIKSIKSTRQITKAMELVSAAKMRRAQMQALATRTYARLAWDLIQKLASQTDPSLHKLLKPAGEVKNIGILLITSNRGLIGGFNNHIISTAINLAKSVPSADFVTMGKKGAGAVRKAGFNIIADFEKRDSSATVAEINPAAKILIEGFVNGAYDRVDLVYMDYVSTLVQKPVVKQLLPLKNLTLPPLLTSARVGERSDSEYLFEPTADYVLETVLPRLTTMQIYQALLETNAAEHSARMVAMKNASDSAADLIEDLTLEYNKIRQGNITREISEIVAGKLALTNY